MITISEAAAEKLRAILAEQHRSDDALRIKITGGGCSGLQYKLEIDAPQAGDKVFERDGAKLVVDRKSFLYLSGSELVYKDGLMDAGFHLDNPNVKRTCGCGASFGV
jgi:iron-sulfur cluster assembly protein